MMSLKVWKRRNIRYYLSKGAHVDEYDQFNLTPLFVSVSYVDHELVSLLIQLGADVKKETGSGYSPLHAAIITGQTIVCDLLLKHGATFWTPLHEAAFHGDLETIKLLYPYTDKAQPIWHKAPFIFYAIGGNNLDIVKWLVKQDPSAATQNNLYGNTPLMCTTWSGNKTIAGYLIDNTTANTLERSDSKMTALLWAALHGNVDMIKFLLDHGSSLSESQEDGCTPLLWAVKNGHVELLEWLLQNGCSLSEKTKYGNTPLLCAAKEGEVEMVACLLKHGAKLEESNLNEENALVLAASSEGYLELVRFLLEHGVHDPLVMKKALTKAADNTIWLCLKYHMEWPSLRLLFIGHLDKSSPFCVIPIELIVVIGGWFQC